MTLLPEEPAPGNVNKPYVVDLMTGLTNAGLTIDENLKQLYGSHKDFNNKANKVSGTRRELTELKVSRNSIERLATANDLAILHHWPSGR